MNQELKDKKMDFLAETIKRCLERDPILSYEEIVFILIDEIGINNMPEFLKKYKKQLKSNY